MSHNLQDNAVYIAAYGRTPIGSFQGSLSSFSATQLGSLAIKGVFDRYPHLKTEDVDEVILGNVLNANLGQNPARQASLGSQKIGLGVPCSSVNKVCASGLKAITLAAQSILAGVNRRLVVAGGMESMSNCPYYVGKARTGLKYGHGTMIDGIMRDGLEDAYSVKEGTGNAMLMGDAAELCAVKHGFDRIKSDEFAISSYTNATSAHVQGKFKGEMIPVVIPASRSTPEKVIDKDEDPSKFNADKLKTMKPAFKPDGTVTAANASGLNDGAAVVVLVSGAYAREQGIPVLARLVSWADSEVEPLDFTISPSIAVPKALSAGNLRLDQIDYFEINEAFSVVALSNQKLLSIAPEKLNVYGGAVALGHPLGCSGARIVCTMISVLKQENGKLGCCAICNGGGGATCLILERVD